MTMTINSPIYRACGKNDVRTYLNQPFYDKKAGKIVATDGHILAVVTPSIEPDSPEDDGGHLPVEALKAAQKSKTLRNQVHANGAVKVLGTNVEYPRPDHGDRAFPEWERVVVPHDDNAPVIAFNVELLYELAMAIGVHARYKGVRLQLPVDKDGKIDPTRSIRVETGHDSPNDVYGILMPMRL